MSRIAAVIPCDNPACVLCAELNICPFCLGDSDDCQCGRDPIGRTFVDPFSLGEREGAD